MSIVEFSAKLKNMGKTVDQKISTTTKKHAEGVLFEFKTLMRGGMLTPRLKPSTIKSKRQKGMPFPQTPLYGWGLTSKNSMINGLRVETTGKGGWRLRPFGKHDKISMQKLFAIHEYGATLKNGGKIPARKPLRRAVEAYKKSAEFKNQNIKLVKSIAAGLR